MGYHGTEELEMMPRFRFGKWVMMIKKKKKRERAVNCNRLQIC